MPDPRFVPDPRSRRGQEPDPMWGDGTVTIPAPPPRREFNPPPPVTQDIPAFLAGSGGGTPQTDPIEVTGVRRRIEVDPITLSGPTQIPAPPGRSEFNPATQADPGLPPILAGSGYRAQPDPIEITGVRQPSSSRGSGVSQIVNRAMPEGGDAYKFPEPPAGPQAIQGIPPMLARPPASAAARVGPKAPRPTTASPKSPEAVFAQAASDTESPDFLAYVRQRAQDKLDVARAQGKADDARKWQDVANGFVRAGDVAAGRKTDEGALQQRLENTAQPVRNVLQQQEVGRQATGEALAQTQLSGKMWEQRMATQAADINSPISQRNQKFLASTGLFAPGAEKFVAYSDWDHALQAGSQGIKALALKAEIAHQNAQLAIERGKAAEDIRHHDQEYDVGMFRARPAVQPTQQNDIEALINGASSVNDLENVNKNAGFFNRVGSAFGVGPAAETRKAVAPAVAKAGAKGRVNPAGEVKEANSLPGPNTSGGDDNLRTRRMNMLRDADAKLSVLEHDPRVEPNSVAQLRQQWNTEMQREGASGTGAPGAPAAAHPQDSEALSWAKSHPNDPAAATILHLNGAR